MVVEVLPSLLLWYHPMAQAKGAAKDLDLYPCIECSVTLFYPMLHTIVEQMVPSKLCHLLALGTTYQQDDKCLGPPTEEAHAGCSELPSH